MTEQLETDRRTGRGRRTADDRRSGADRRGGDDRAYFEAGNRERRFMEQRMFSRRVGPRRDHERREVERFDLESTRGGLGTAGGWSQAGPAAVASGAREERLWGAPDGGPDGFGPQPVGWLAD